MTDGSTKTTPKDVEALFERGASALFDDASEGEHISDERVAILADQGGAMTPEEIAHVARCAECAEVVGGVLAAKPGNAIRRGRGAHWARRAPLLVAVAAAAGVLFVALPREDGLRSKGGLEATTADVALVAIGRERKRDLRTGGTVRLDEQIGFKYGNVEGEHATLTIAGWDGRRVHWYYPERADEAPPRIEGGPAAQGLRLPFDIKLEGYPKGALRIIAAFDTEPAAVAAALESEAFDGLGVYRVFDVEVVP